MQSNLFADQTDPACFEEHDLGDACVREYPQGFTPEESRRLLAQLIETVPWQQDSLWIAGREIAVPRLQCWMGDHGSLYGYSGMRLEPVPWCDIVQHIRKRIRTLTGLDFNSVLLNYYRDGRDSVAWHADDERELGPDPVIASVSLGAERQFQLRHKRDRQRSQYRLLLRHGSILVMGNTLQNNWLHQLPKAKGLLEPRVNLTFRTIVRPVEGL